MPTLTKESKIRSDHLDRQAFVYVRQSTLFQVRENTASTARQYDLKRRACEMGWSESQVVVIDQDQAQSGSQAVARDGFQFLIAEVGLGRAGAVFSLEVSRLARNNSDWHRLLEICALTDTLVVDEEGVYDPGLHNDRLLLGIKGALSEAELHWLRSRLLGGKLQKAEHGELRFRPPTGFVFDPANHLVRDPDEEVQQAVTLVFSLFEQHNSALTIVKHFNTHNLRFPTRHWGKRRAGELTWGPLTHGRVLDILHNPAYTGTYVYGRTKTRTRILPSEASRIKGRTRQVAQEDWPIVLHDAHPSYISWAQFLGNQQQLDDNRTFRAEERRGVVREGAALLQGLVLCGRCGRRMGVRYLSDGKTPIYVCAALHTQRAGPTCDSLRGDGVDAAVSGALLEAVQSAQLEVSLATLDQLDAQAKQIERQWQFRLERVRYEADLAKRRFLAVEPENRLVVRTLERDWNDKLLEVERLEREFASLPERRVRRIDANERGRILALSQDMPAVWQATTTSHAERKHLLRLLIKDVTLTKRDTTFEIGIRWQTEALTQLTISRPQRSCDTRRSDPAVVDRVRALAPDHSDSDIADILNQEGAAPGLGGMFSKSKVYWIRYAYGLAQRSPGAPRPSLAWQRSDGRYSARAAAELLNVDVSTIADWCQAGRLDYVQRVPHGPRWVTLTPELLATLRKPVRQYKPRRASASA